MPKTIYQYITILVVDDDPVRKEIYKNTFQANKNIIYHLTEPANDLTIQLKRKKIDVLIIHMQCITQDEVEFLSRIKSENPQIKILLITKPTNSKEIFKRSEGEIDNYLFTPFSSEDLIVTVKNIM
ncbi:MAG: response regulator [Elusimicrobia bacterium]|nr:response regulator [Elusimicrobiota bacterium]